MHTNTTTVKTVDQLTPKYFSRTACIRLETLCLSIVVESKLPKTTPVRQDSTVLQRQHPLKGLEVDNMV